MAKLLLLIGLGGAIGSVCRYLLSIWIQPERVPVAGVQAGAAAFPLGTLVVNVTGCLAIGVLGTLLYGANSTVRPEIRAFVLVGILGGYTTFSSFGRETIALISGHQVGMAAAYVVLSNVLGLGAVWVGVRVTQQFVGA